MILTAIKLAPSKQQKTENICVVMFIMMSPILKFADSWKTQKININFLFVHQMIALQKL